MTSLKNDFLKDENGNVITAYHGTYYNFDYFYPLMHFGPEKSAKVVLGEGKWKRDKNIDINKPLIIPVLFKNIKLIELLDLNDHSYSNYRAVLFADMCGEQISDYLNFLEAADDYEYFQTHAQQKQDEILSKDIYVPPEFDFICQPITDNFDSKIIQSELALDNLFVGGGQEQLFHQRMIHYFESKDIGGFKYKNYTEGNGILAYIIFRQGNIIRQDKFLPDYPKNNAENIIKLKEIKDSYRKESRILTKSELKDILKEMYEFYNFRFYSKNRTDRNFDAMD